MCSWVLYCLYSLLSLICSFHLLHPKFLLLVQVRTCLLSNATQLLNFALIVEFLFPEAYTALLLLLSSFSCLKILCLISKDTQNSGSSSVLRLLLDYWWKACQGYSTGEICGCIGLCLLKPKNYKSELPIEDTEYCS